MDISIAKRDSRLATEVANELYEAVRPYMQAGATNVEAQVKLFLPHIFGRACERYGLQNEEEVKRAFGCVEPTLAQMHRRFDRLARKVERATRKAERRAGR